MQVSRFLVLRAISFAIQLQNGDSLEVIVRSFSVLRQRGGSLGTSGVKEGQQKVELSIVTTPEEQSSSSASSSSSDPKLQSSPASPRQQMADGLSPADECVGRAATPSQQEGGGMCLRRWAAGAGLSVLRSHLATDATSRRTRQAYR